MFKVNFDGSISSGLFIRYHLSHGLYGVRKRLSPSTVSFAELATAWEGLCIGILKFKAIQVWLEGDSVTMISWINGLNVNGPWFNPRLRGFKVTHHHHLNLSRCS